MDPPSKLSYLQHFKTLNIVEKFTFGGVMMLPVLFLTKTYFNGKKCELKNDMSDKVIVITGSNTGIGKETAMQLAK